VKNTRGYLMGHALVLDEAVLASRLNGLLVQTHCIGVSPFEAGDLGRHQRVLVGGTSVDRCRPTRAVVLGAPSGVRAICSARHQLRSS